MFKNIVTLVTKADNYIIKNALTGVYLERTNGITYGADGETIASNAKLIVPLYKGCFSESLKKEKEYDNLDLEDKANSITFKKGQLVILGSDIKGKNFDEIKNLNDDCYTIINVSEYLDVIPHIEAVCR